MRPLFIALLLLAMPVLLRAQEDISAQLEREKQAQTGSAITIIFDDSGSMNLEHKLTQAKAAFTTWLSHIPDDYKLSLITFQQGGRIIVPLGENNRAAVTQKVDQLTANSSTPICAALKLAGQQIRERRQKVTPYERQVVLPFTDGAETEDSRGVNGVKQGLQELRTANIEVVGVGFHGQGDYMDGVATRYYSANDEASLTAGLAKVDSEIGDTSDIVVSADELAAMKTQAPGLVAATPTATAESTPVPQASKAVAVKKGPNLLLIIVLVIGYFVLRNLFNKKR